MDKTRERQRVEAAIKKYEIDRFFTDVNPYVDGMRLIERGKHAFLLSHAEDQKYVYFLLEGTLQVHSVGENGEQMLVRTCESFIFLGDMELLGFDNGANTVTTLTKCLFLAIDMSLMKEKMLSDPVFLRFLCDNLAEKINHFARKQFQNKALSNRQKVVSHILTVGGEKGYFKENLRRTSELLDVSYRHLHRILSELVEVGALERTSRGYEIRRMGMLEEIYWQNEK